MTYVILSWSTYRLPEHQYIPTPCACDSRPRLFCLLTYTFISSLTVQPVPTVSDGTHVNANSLDVHPVCCTYRVCDIYLDGSMYHTFVCMYLPPYFHKICVVNWCIWLPCVFASLLPVSRNHSHARTLPTPCGQPTQKQVYSDHLHQIVSFVIPSQFFADASNESQYVNDIPKLVDGHLFHPALASIRKSSREARASVATAASGGKAPGAGGMGLLLTSLSIVIGVYCTVCVHVFMLLNVDT